MLKKLTLMLTTAALGTAALAIPTAASAQRYGYGEGYGGGYGDRYEQAYGDAYRDGYNRGPRYYRERGYDYRDDYRDRDYRPRRCNDGTTGTVLGAIAGGLLGNGLAGRGDRGLGTILGAGGGALAGRAIGRSNNPGYCR